MIKKTHLIANTTEPLGNALVAHQLLALAALEGGKAVGEHTEDEGGLVELEGVSAGLGILLQTGKCHTADDDWQTRDLGVAGWFAVKDGIDQGRQDGLAGLDNLSKERIAAQGKDRAGMRSGTAKSNWQGLLDVVLGGFRNVLLGGHLQTQHLGRVDLDDPH